MPLKYILDMFVHESISVTSLIRRIPFGVEATWFGVLRFICRNVPVITRKHGSRFKMISVILIVFAACQPDLNGLFYLKACGAPICTILGKIRNVSLIVAWIQGKSSQSVYSGNRFALAPQTASSCARTLGSQRGS